VEMANIHGLGSVPPKKKDNKDEEEFNMGGAARFIFRLESRAIQLLSVFGNLFS
jgi:hypothetical protein